MRPRWPSTGRGRAPTHPLGPQRSGGRPATAFLPREECRRAQPAGRGRKSATVVAVQAHEAKPHPVQIGLSKDETEDGWPEPAQDGDARRPRDAHPATRTASPGASPAASPSWSATTGAGRTKRGPLDGPSSGQSVRSRLSAWTGRRAKDGTRERAPAGQALTVSSGTAASASSKPAARPHRHGSADRHRGASPQGGALRPALEEKTRAERGDRTDGRTRMSRRAAGERGSTTVAGPLFGAL